MTHIHLLEPYRTCLTVLGILENLVEIADNHENLTDLMATSTFQIGMQRDLQARTLQLLLLFDDVSIVNYESVDRAIEVSSQGYASLIFRPLKDRGLIRFVTPELPDELDQKYEEIRTLEDFWQLSQEKLEELEPILTSQMMARGKLPHERLYYILKHHRLGEPEVAQRLIASLPHRHRRLGRAICSDAPGVQTLDVGVLSTFNELIATETARSDREFRLALARLTPPSEQVPLEDSTEGVPQLFEIILGGLEESGIPFVVPNSLTAVEDLRDEPEISEFRSIFLPWLDSLTAGKKGDERRLRTEVMRAAVAFEHKRAVRDISSWTAYASLVAGLSIPITGPAGEIASTSSAIASIGMTKLARRWEAAGRWVGLFAGD